MQLQAHDLKLDEDCIFCRIIKGEIPCTRVYEDDNLISFLDIAPANKGHCLVMPKNHHETMLDLPNLDLALAMKKAKEIARAMSSALGNQGFNILINNKREAGQIVPHFHLHIIPRFADDRISLNWQPRKYKPDEIDGFADKIKSFL